MSTQAGDMDTVQAALQPALAAIAGGEHKLSRHAESSSAHTDWTAQVRREAPFLLRYTAAWVYTAMCTAAVSLMEKQRRYHEATELLQQLLGGPHIGFRLPSVLGASGCTPANHGSVCRR